MYCYDLWSKIFLSYYIAPSQKFKNRIKYQIYNQSAKNKQHKSNIYIEALMVSRISMVVAIHIL